MHGLSVYNDRIKLRPQSFFSLSPSAEGTLEDEIDISQVVAGGSAYVRPKLTYVAGREVRARTTSLTLVALTVPKEQLVSLLRENNMLGD